MYLTQNLFLLGVLGIATKMASAQEYVGRVPCPTNSSLMGYTNTTLLNSDIITDMQFIYNGGDMPEYFHYILCPQTTFKVASLAPGQEMEGDSPIIPGLSNSLFTCGEEGNSEDNCIIEGGDFHFYFPDFVIADQVYIAGLTFSGSKGASIYGDAHPSSHVVFIDCHWKFNTGTSTVYVHFTEDEGGRRELEEKTRPYDMDEMKQLMSKKAGALTTKKHSRDLQTFFKYSMSCVFVDSSFIKNDDIIATIFNLGGAIELIGTELTENNVAELSTFSVLGGGHAFIHEGTSFKNNFARLGPIYIDNVSFLHLSRDNSGESNKGSKCDGIFLEDSESLCFDKNEKCEGECCAFGDETCDLYTDDVPSSSPSQAPKSFPKPSPTPPSPSPPSGQVSQPSTQGSTSSSSSSVAMNTQANTESSGGSCTGYCLAFTALFGAVLVAILVIMFVIFRRTQAKRSMDASTASAGPSDFEDPPVVDKEIA